MTLQAGGRRVEQVERPTRVVRAFIGIATLLGNFANHRRKFIGNSVRDFGILTELPDDAIQTRQRTFQVNGGMFVAGRRRFDA